MDMYNDLRKVVILELLPARRLATLAWRSANNSAKEIDFTEDLLPAFDIQQQLAAQRLESATTLHQPVEHSLRSRL